MVVMLMDGVTNVCVGGSRLAEERAAQMMDLAA
jgi:hypothetical protein